MRLIGIGASTRLFGAVRAPAELRKVLKSIGADVVDAELSHEAFYSGGGLRDPELVTLRAIVHRLVGQALRSAA